nr:SprT family zinc-dependent metalloprotease [Achromobacter ruhlandii]
MSLYSLAYGDERIRFSVRFLPRTRRRVSIHVMPDGSVQVDAPEFAEIPQIKQAVRVRAGWVWQQLEALRARRHHVLLREYVSGETHFYLGRRHMLKVQVAGQADAGVRLWRGRLEITVAERNAADVRKLLEAWYRRRAQEVFGRILMDMAASMRLLKSLPRYRLLSMRTQWGSCSPKGELLFNPALIKAPRACIEYVVAHELCHLKEKNHSDRFYRLLAAAVPDWQTRKRELDDLAEQLLNR